MASARSDLKSILPHLPPFRQQNCKLTWPNPTITTTLTTLTKGPTHSKVDTGSRFSSAITKLRDNLPLPPKDKLSKSFSKGYAKFFDQVLPKEESGRFFENVVPIMADLVLRLPALLEEHYADADGVLSGVPTGLRLLDQNRAGIVFLSKELIGSMLSCSFFCLYPTSNRKAKHMRPMNFDQMFASIHDKQLENQENKLKCILHYFERICSCKLSGFVSFERKVFPREPNAALVTYPTPDFWANSVVPICQFQIFNSGKIEHHPGSGLEVDFADEFLGGLVMTKGCVQEEIRFMMNPELIAGMIFLPSMLENEAIEIVGAERFSNYTGYSKTFKFTGDYVDRRAVDSRGRRISRVIAIDALRRAGTRQYQSQFLLREVNKAFCGFLDHPQCKQYQLHSDFGVVTGNWGCGIFGGDPQIKSMIQWIAASQASRPFVAYYTFGLDKVRNMSQVRDWIVAQKWTVGDLWKSLADYCSQRANGKTKSGYFSWLIPSLEESSDKPGGGTKRKRKA